MYAQVRDQRRSEVATKFDLEGEHDANEVGRSCRACDGTFVQVLLTHLKPAFEGLSLCQSQTFSAMTHFPIAIVGVWEQTVNIRRVFPQICREIDVLCFSFSKSATLSRCKRDNFEGC